MDPEQEINAYLRSKGVQHAVLKDMLDQFAHNLAEAIREAPTPDDVAAVIGYTAIYKAGLRAGADLIDPEVRK